MRFETPPEMQEIAAKESAKLIAEVIAMPAVQAVLARQLEAIGKAVIANAGPSDLFPAPVVEVPSSAWRR